MLQRFRRWAVDHPVQNRVVASVIFGALFGTFTAARSSSASAVGVALVAGVLYFVLGYYVFDRRPRD